jgi:hypothetical protein
MGHCPVFPRLPVKSKEQRKQLFACPAIQSENVFMKIGYARVLTGDHNPAMQVTSLNRTEQLRIKVVRRYSSFTK